MNQGKLVNPLGSWIKISDREYQQLYDHDNRKLLIQTGNGTWLSHDLIHTRRRTMEFTHQGTQRTTPPTTAVAIDILS
jgi:hypothetical protein